jgi:hypothetical protein
MGTSVDRPGRVGVDVSAVGSFSVYVGLSLG